MSNHLAIATVTASLCQILQEAVDNDLPVVSGANVSNDRPNKIDTATPPTPGVNVFLYQVTPNPTWRNTDLPSRRGNGADVIQRPRVALDLHYLMSFHGNDSELEPQRLLGSVARVLHTKPVLDRQRIRSLVNNASYAFLKGSNLAEDIEAVRFAPAALSLEELSKLWSVVFQTPYYLSAAYQASVVLIESDDTLQTPLPVQERRVFVVALQQPTIDDVVSLDNQGNSIPIVAGGTLTIRGNELRGDLTQISLGGEQITPTAVSPTRIDVSLTSPPFSTGTLRAGVQGVQVIQFVRMGKQPLPPPPAGVPHPAFESNLAAFVLQPTIVPGAVTSAQVTLAVKPNIRTGQRVTMLLNKVGPAPSQAYAFSPAALPTVDTNSITIAINGVAPGQYFVRLQVDGADSPLDFDPASPTFGPTVTIS